MFTVYACHPLISITLPFCLPSSSLAFLTSFAPSPPFLSPSLLSLQTMWPPRITHHELLRWNPALLCCPTNHRPSLLLCFLSSYPLSLLYWCFFCSLISTSGSRSYLRFLRVTWDLAFFHSFGANPEEFGHCNPAAHASLVTAGGRALQDRLTAHIHTQRLQYFAGVQPSKISGLMVLAAH